MVLLVKLLMLILFKNWSVLVDCVIIIEKELIKVLNIMFIKGI